MHKPGNAKDCQKPPEVRRPGADWSRLPLAASEGADPTVWTPRSETSSSRTEAIPHPEGWSLVETPSTSHRGGRRWEKVGKVFLRLAFLHSLDLTRTYQKQQGGPVRAISLFTAPSPALSLPVLH